LKPWIGLNLSICSVPIKWQNVLCDLFVSIFQEKTFEQVDKLKPWRDRFFLREVRRLARLKTKSREWREQKVRVSLLEDDLKERYINAKLEKFRVGTPAQYWKIINTIIHPEKDDNWNPTLLWPEKSEDEVADVLSKYFSSISNSFSPINNPDIMVLDDDDADVIPVITVIEVSDLIKVTRFSTLTVPGDIPGKVFKYAGPKLCVPVAAMFNRVVKSGIFPDVWKRETVTVIPKKKNPKELNDLRNISLTPLIAKLFEEIMARHLLSAVEPRLSLRQFGGLKHRSGDQLLADLTQKLIEATENGHAAVVLNIDQSKAFNRVDHTKLVKKLKEMVVPGWLVRLHASYLSMRTMRIKLNGRIFEERMMFGGCPQGLVLGALDYVIYSNSIGEYLPESAEQF
jgi:hypothetical protein